MLYHRYLYAFPFIFLWSFPALTQDMGIERMMLMHEVKPQQPAQPKTTKVDRPKNLPEPIRVLIDVRSNHSDGAHDFQTLIQLAKARYLDALAFNEHDRFSIRLGLEPIPHIIGYSQEHPSLYQSGLAQFFTDLELAKQSTDLTLMAGTESTAGYDWQGIPFKSLSLHQAERHLITLGVTQQKQIESLTSYTLKHGYGNKALSLVFWFVFVFMLIFILLRKRKRGVALLLAGSFIAFLSTWLLKPTTDMDQDFINSAHTQNLFVIWAHPGTLSGVREGPMGVQLVTPPYNEHVFEVPADAFAAVYGDTDNNTKPNGLWDRFMMDYMKGYIAKPMWAVAAGDYHEEGQSGEYLGNYPMDVWSKSSQEKDILNALQQGNMTAWHMSKQYNLSMHTLFLEYQHPETRQTNHVLTGSEHVVGSNIKLVVGLKGLGNTPPIQLQGHWIINGKIVEKVMLSSTDTQVLATELSLPQGRHVIRFQIPPQHGVRMESNPFLIQVRSST